MFTESIFYPLSEPMSTCFDAKLDIFIVDILHISLLKKKFFPSLTGKGHQGEYSIRLYNIVTEDHMGFSPNFCTHGGMYDCHRIAPLS